MRTLVKKWPNYKTGGAYGMIFFESENKAIKVFKKNGHPREHMENVFRSEVKAYQIAMNEPKLRGLVPKFYSEVIIDRIEDASGNDISKDFHLDLSYEMEKIEGDFVKAGSLGKEATEEIESLLHSFGILYTLDMDAIVKDNVIEKVIDFATEEFVLEHTPITQPHP